MYSSYGRRIRAIGLPCPSCIPISTKAASLVACAVMTVCYLAWALALWKGYFQLSEIKAGSSGTTKDQLVLMARYAEFTAWYAITETCLCLGAFAVSAWPQAETAKWLSRLIWFGWITSWGFGIFGIVAYIAPDAFVAAGCERGNECWAIRQRLQIGLTVAVFVTLAIVFYCAIILSAFVHTLHPHLFISPDSDSEDEYSDGEEHAAHQLEEELLRSGHPYAGEAVLALEEERRRRVAQRGASRRRPGFAPEVDDAALPQGTSSRAKQGTGTVSAPRQEQYSSDGEYSSSAAGSGSGSGSSDEERAERGGLMRGAAGGDCRGRPTARGHARQLSDISSSGADDYSAEEGAPPQYQSRERSRSTSANEMGRRRSSQSRSRAGRS